MLSVLRSEEKQIPKQVAFSRLAARAKYEAQTKSGDRRNQNQVKVCGKFSLCVCQWSWCARKEDEIAKLEKREKPSGGRKIFFLVFSSIEFQSVIEAHFCIF